MPFQVIHWMGHVVVGEHRAVAGAAVRAVPSQAPLYGISLWHGGGTSRRPSPAVGRASTIPRVSGQEREGDRRQHGVRRSYAVNRSPPRVPGRREPAPDCPISYRSAPMNRTLSDSNASRHLPAPSTTHSRGASTRCTGSYGLLRQALVEAPQHAAAADEVDALLDEVLGQLGRGVAEAADHRVDDGPHLLVDGLPDLLGRQDGRLGQPAHEVAAPHLGLHLVGRSGRPSRWRA